MLLLPRLGVLLVGRSVVGEATAASSVVAAPATGSASNHCRARDERNAGHNIRSGGPAREAPFSFTPHPAVSRSLAHRTLPSSAPRLSSPMSRGRPDHGRDPGHHGVRTRTHQLQLRHQHRRRAVYINCRRHRGEDNRLPKTRATCVDRRPGGRQRGGPSCSSC